MENLDTPPIGPVDSAAFEELPSWPKVVGIVSICWSSLGIFCTGCGVAGLLMLPQFMSKAEEQLGPMPDVMKPNFVQMIFAGIGIIPVAILMVAGILTVRRSKAGAIAHLLYGGVGLITGLIGTAYGIMHQLELQTWGQQNASSKWAQQAGSPAGWIGLVVAALIGIAYPLFCLVWFGLIKRNADMGKDEPVSI